MKLIVHLPGMIRAQAEQVAAGVAAFVPGARIEIVNQDLSDPRLALKKLEETGRFVLANMLGTHVATVGPLEAAMCMTLMDCRAVFQSSKELLMALEQWPCWKGQRHQVRQVYANLRKKMTKTRYPLVNGRGVYGFAARLESPGKDLGVGVLAT